MPFRSQNSGYLGVGWEVMTGREPRGGFWEAGDVLFFNLGASDTRGSTCENLSSYTFIIGVHLFVFTLYFNKVFQNYQYHS